MALKIFLFYSKSEFKLTILPFDHQHEKNLCQGGTQRTERCKKYPLIINKFWESAT